MRSDLLVKNMAPINIRVRPQYTFQRVCVMVNAAQVACPPMILPCVPRLVPPRDLFRTITDEHVDSNSSVIAAHHFATAIDCFLGVRVPGSHAIHKQHAIKFSRCKEARD